MEPIFSNWVSGRRDRYKDDNEFNTGHWAVRNKAFMQQTLIGLVPVEHTGCNWASTSPGHQV
jgi:hypothetical protein